MRQPNCSEVAVYHAHIFCSVKGGTEIILSVPLASKLSAQEQEKHSQILSLSLSSHLGNGNLYLQTVGAGGEHEILKSTLSLFPSSLPAWPACPLTSYAPSHTFHQWNALQSSLPVVHSLLCKSNIPVVSGCRAPHTTCLQLLRSPALFTVYILHPDTTPDLWWHEAEKHQFFWISTLMHSQTKYVYIIGAGVGGGALETNSLCSAFHNMYWYVV